MTQLISIIIPVYNAEKYLQKGIESLLNQTYKNIEIILIDDKSTDKSWDMCKEYEDKYPEKIRIFRNKKNNGGPFRSRIEGFQKAKGDWITTMDCDDFVEPKYIEHLINTTENGKYDVAVTGHQKYWENDKIEKFLWDDYSQSTENRLATFYNHLITNNFWTDPTDTSGQNLFRASILKEINFSDIPSNIWAEDTFLALAFIANSKKGVNFKDYHDFNWLQRKGSGSQGGFSQTADRKSFYKACFDILYKKNIYDIISINLPLISLIVPVYNVEEYLDDCIESMLNQTYGNIEIILVNDGSTDESKKICEKFVKLDKRVKLISIENSGINIAREKGFYKSKGEFILFVDSDDMISKNSVRSLYEAIIKENTDISIGGYKKFKNKNELLELDHEYHYEVTTERNKTSILSWLFSNNIQGISTDTSKVLRMTAWGKLYKRSIIEKTDWNFSNYRSNEDELENLQWYNLTENGITILNEPIYYYRTNPNSVTKKRYNNTNPDGHKINRFEFNDEYFQKVREYLKTPVFEEILTQKYIWNIQNYTYNSINENSLNDEKESLLISLNNYINEKEKIIKAKEETINNLKLSKTWRFTKIFRVIFSNYFFRKTSQTVRKIYRFFRRPRTSYKKVKKIMLEKGYQKKYGHGWLISDRPDSASDNGIIFYNYLCKNHKNVNAYYVLDSTSEDFIKLLDAGAKVIDRNSDEYKIAYAYADIEASAFFNFAPFTPEQLGISKKPKKVFLRHGIEQSDLSAHYKNLNCDLIVDVLDESVRFYKDGKSKEDIRDLNIQALGMSRYDLIKDFKNNNVRRNKIVIAPTWRRYLFYKVNSNEKIPEGEFKKSKYYKYYNKIFNSQEVKNLSKKYEVVFIPHPEITARINEFDIPEFITIKEYSELKTEGLYRLASETELFLSDYSSTTFDFAFLGSKIVYFNFDEKDYYSDKMSIYRSWFDLKTNGFGPYFENTTQILKYLGSEDWFFENDRIDRISKQIPDNSSRDIYKAIVKIIEKDNK